MQKLWEQGVRPTAVVCACDNSALGIYRFLYEKGLRCPEDVYIEAAGHPFAVQQGLDMIRKGGTYVEFSVMSGTSTIDWSIIGDTKEIAIYGFQLSPNCYQPVIDWMVEGKLRTDGIISHKYPLKEWQQAYAMAQTQQALKVILIF